MRELMYIMKDPMGFHARPASAIFMEARKFACRIEAEAGGKTADAKELLDLMSLVVRGGETFRFRFDGSDEEEAFAALEKTLSDM